MSTEGFFAEYDKRGAASCKKCKVKLNKGELRLGKSVPNHFSDSGSTMKQWFHSSCMFEVWKRARASTPVLQACPELVGWGDLRLEDQQLIERHFEDLDQQRSSKAPLSGNKKNKQELVENPRGTNDSTNLSAVRMKGTSDIKKKNSDHLDNSFGQFRKLVNSIAHTSGHIDKANIVQEFFSKGSSGAVQFVGDVMLWLRSLLPGVIKRIYNLQTKQLLKLFSQIFETDHDDMVEDSHQGDVAATVSRFFSSPSSRLKPCTKSCLTLKKVDDLLEELSGVTIEEDQLKVLEKISKQCTVEDLEIVIRLIKHDLRMGAGAKPILTGFHPNAYSAFQSTRDLSVVVSRFTPPAIGNRAEALPAASTSSSPATFGIQVMTPVLPMLAAPCRQLGKVLASHPEGLYAEIKYDGERVQVHFHDGKFEFYSRSLKPVLAHKVSHVIEYLPQAFPNGSAIVLDCEVLLMDTNTGQPLPFGTLGVHKRTAFKDASVCIFVFDCLHFNGQDITKKSLKERRRILEQNMKPITHRILLSDLTLVEDVGTLKRLTMKTFSEGLEGLVLKDPVGQYQPGKRGWLKVKRDYLNEGKMADTADLVVLGAWYGTGACGGILSVFLMGCYDEKDGQWRTVTKLHSVQFNDKTINRLQGEMEMVKVVDGNVPSWLKCHRTMIPHVVAKNPKNSPVWEIMGAEFTQSKVHTANGLSFRFPRISRFREDKSWKEATSVQELTELYKQSKIMTDLILDEIPTKKCKRELPNNLIDVLTFEKTKYTLPALFTGLNFYLDCESGNERNDISELRRYIRAYDGDVSYAFNSSVDYIISPNFSGKDSSRLKESLPKNNRQEIKSSKHRLQAAWVWDCITSSTRLSTDNYVVLA